MPEFNSMQANLGLIPGVGAPNQVIQSPASIAAQLSQQATRQLQEAQQMMPVAVGGGGGFSFGQQYQQQLDQIQRQQSMGIYQAAMMAGGMPGGGMMPSPLTMTPPSTGIFRPAAQAPSFAPIAPVPIMPMAQTPFQPSMPPPMFQSAWEQEMQQRELRADKLYSYTAQVPRALGTGAGIGMGALAGGMLGGRFGGIGRAVGALAGAGIAQMSGAAPAMGNLAMMPMRPSMEQHQMGASLQRMSQDWVVGGGQLHPMGRGFSRGASLELAGGLQQMAGSGGFQQQTGGMFNRHDLMQMTQQAGQRGLLDESQNVAGVQQQMRQVAQVVRRFMQLTSDPDVTNVIRQMGQMRQMGLSVAEMDTAAQNMRSFSRAAGTSIGGLMQTYGMPGAATYQQAGLSPGAGMNYGMYAGAAARQAVAAQTFNPQQLSMLGGVQGVAQRNMQAQAAMMSMPLMGAAMGSFQNGQWGADAGNMAGVMGGRGGMQGLVEGAVSNMNQAVGRGGLGALAMFPLQQRQIQSQAAAAMNPYEQTLMRHRLAQGTGERAGLGGAGGYALGARLAFGDDIAGQMILEASNPEFWRSQRAMIHRDINDLARVQRQEIKDNAPSFFTSVMKDATGALYNKAMGNPVISGIVGFGEDVGVSAGEKIASVTSFFEMIKEWNEDINAEDRGSIPKRTPKAATIQGRREMERQLGDQALIPSGELGAAAGRKKGTNKAQLLKDYELAQRPGKAPMVTMASDWTMEGLGVAALGVPVAGPLLAGAIFATAAFTDVDDLVGAGVRVGLGSLLDKHLTPEQKEKVEQITQAREKPSRRMIKDSAGFTDPLGKKSKDVSALLEKKFGLKGLTGSSVINQASGRVAKKAQETAMPGAAPIGASVAEDSVIAALSEITGMNYKDTRASFGEYTKKERADIVANVYARALPLVDAKGEAKLFEDAESLLGGEAKRGVANYAAMFKVAEDQLEILSDSLDFEYAVGKGDKPGVSQIAKIMKIAKVSESMMMVRNAASVSLAGKGEAPILNEMEKRIKDRIAKEDNLQVNAGDSKEVADQKRAAVQDKYLQMQLDVGKGKFALGEGNMLTPEARARITGGVEKLGGIGAMEAVAGIKKYTTTVTYAAALESVRGQMESLGIAPNLSKLLSISADEIKAMESNTRTRGLGAAITKVQNAPNAKAQRKALREAEEAILWLGAVSETTTEEPIVGPKGDVGADLQKTEDKLVGAGQDFAAIFKKFNTGSADLAVGSLNFRRAMESYERRQQLKDDRQPATDTGVPILMDDGQ